MRQFKQAIAEQDSEMDTEKDFLKGKATDPKKTAKQAMQQQTLKAGVTSPVVSKGKWAKLA